MIVTQIVCHPLPDECCSATGQYPGVTYPIVPLVDGAGEVIRIGPDV
jgi:hypothetical protein